MEFDPSKIKIVFMGTPHFAVPSLAALQEHGYQVPLVITNPDMPKGRTQKMEAPPVKVYAQAHNLPVVQPYKLKDIEGELQTIKPDCIVLAAYGKILPPWVLSLPKRGALNVHPSLLPRWRGASPIQFTILAGDEETGVTIFCMNERMDEGPIIAISNIKKLPQPHPTTLTEKEKILLQKSKMTTGELTNILAEEGAKLLIETLPKWIRGEIKPIPQQDEDATYTKILTREDGRIMWSKPAHEIERQIRAFDPWPGSFTYVLFNGNQMRFKILKADKEEGLLQDHPGTIISYKNHKVAITCGSGLLIPLEVQLEGGKPMAIEDFLRGHPYFMKGSLQ